MRSPCHIATKGRQCRGARVPAAPAATCRGLGGRRSDCARARLRASAIRLRMGVGTRGMAAAAAAAAAAPSRAAPAPHRAGSTAAPDMASRMDLGAARHPARAGAEHLAVRPGGMPADAARHGRAARAGCGGIAVLMVPRAVLARMPAAPAWRCRAMRVGLRKSGRTRRHTRPPCTWCRAAQWPALSLRAPARQTRAAGSCNLVAPGAFITTGASIAPCVRNGTAWQARGGSAAAWPHARRSWPFWRQRLLRPRPHCPMRGTSPSHPLPPPSSAAPARRRHGQRRAASTSTPAPVPARRIRGPYGALRSQPGTLY